MKKKVFTVNSKNVKQTIGMQVTFVSENKLLKDHFFCQYITVFPSICDFQFKSLLDWECPCLCHDLRIEKKET